MSVSVIIPVWNDAACLAQLLPRLSNERAVAEILVVDGGSTDDLAALAAQFPAVRRLHSGRGRGRQMNAGARMARGEVLLFLHADTLPAAGAIAELPTLLAARNADFGAFRLRFDRPYRLLRALAWFTRFSTPWTCYGDQGIFVRRSFFEETGGFPEIPLLEDVHWLRRAARRGRMTRSTRVAVTSARRFADRGVMRQTWQNLSILVRDRMGTDPVVLAALYARGTAKTAGAAKSLASPQHVD